VWTALSLPYRLSAAYTVSVVQIESGRQRRLALPVTSRRLHIALLRRPQITALYRTPLTGEAIGDLRVKVTGSLTIEGANFNSSKTLVRVGGLAPIPPTSLSNQRIELVVPDDPVLQPGPQVVEVLTRRPTDVVQGGLDKGTVLEEETVQRSNQAVFMLVPDVTAVALESGTVTVTGHRLYQTGLRSYVIVGDLAIEVPAGPDQEPTSVQVPLPPLPTGLYPVRVRVNGAESTEDRTIQVP
jgi:hypothetical protein